MNYLDHLAADVRRIGALDLDWEIARNVYFRAPTPEDTLDAATKWAEIHGFACLVSYRSESPVEKEPLGLRFLPIPLPPR
jgi:hypothetical protein